MPEFPSQHPVLCRPARPADRMAVMDLTADIWDGDDYVPRVWDHWFWQDPGLLAVAVREGQLVGLGNLLDMGLGEWWLRGLRVDPDHQGEGIGAHLHNYFVDQWLRTDGRVVRLATHAHRIAVHHMCDRTGFNRVFTFVLTTGDPDPSSEPGIEPADVTPEVLAGRLLEAPLAKAFSGTFDLGWRFGEVRAERMCFEGDTQVVRHAASGSLVVIRRTGQEAREAQVLATDAPVAALTEVLAAVRRWAAVQEFDEVTCLAPDVAEFTEAAVRAGFQLEQEDTLHVYERRR